MRGQVDPRRGMVDPGRVGLAGDCVQGGGRVGRDRDGQRDDREHGHADRESGQPPQRRGSGRPQFGQDGHSQNGQGQQDQGLHGDGGPGQPGGPAGPLGGLAVDGVQQQPDGHGVFRMPPAHGDTPQRGGARRGQHEAPGPGRTQPFGQCVGGEQGHGRDTDLVRPSQQPQGRVGLVRHHQGEPGQVGQGDRRHHDHGRAGQRHQLGGRGVQAGQIQVQQPLGRDHRAPQVVGQRPGGLAVVARPPDRAGYPDGGHADRGQQREQPVAQAPRSRVHDPIVAVRERKRSRPCQHPRLRSPASVFLRMMSFQPLAACAADRQTRIVAAVVGPLADPRAPGTTT